VVVLAVVLTYANSLSGAFVLDDQATIVQNPEIRDLSLLGAILSPAPDSPIAGRPLASLSFALNYAAGGLEVRGYHAVNIALHTICALLVLTLVRRAAERWEERRSGVPGDREERRSGVPGDREERRSGVPGDRKERHERTIDASRLAFAASLLWAVHPLNSEVLNYLSQRTESMMAVCYLTAMYAAIRAAGARAGLRWEALAVLSCAAGALCKESIATAPLMIVLFDRVFIFDAWGRQWAERRRLYIGLAATWMIVGLLLAQGPRAAVVGFSSGVSPWLYLLNQAEAITHYLRLVVWPDALVAFYGWPVPTTLADAAPYLVLIGGLVLATAAAWRWRPVIAFLGTWFFVTLAPASSIVPVSTEVAAERRMYLPLVAVAVLAALAIDRAVQWMARRVRLARPGVTRATSAAIVLVVAALLASVTAARNREYRSPLTLARTIVERRPTPVAHHMLGEELALAGLRDEALLHLRNAVAGGNSRARYLLGRILASQEKHGEAIEQLQAFVNTYRPARPLVPKWLEAPITDVVPARFTMGRAHGLRGEWDRAEEQARLILDLVPGHIGAQGLLGDAMFARQEWESALEHYRRYLAREPSDPRALINYGIAHVAVGRLDGAVAAFRRAAEIDPADARARELLAMAEQDRARAVAAP
jgi:tetratricopeptide (TPR) repeat protein